MADDFPEWMQLMGGDDQGVGQVEEIDDAGDGVEELDWAAYDASAAEAPELSSDRASEFTSALDDLAEEQPRPVKPRLQKSAKGAPAKPPPSLAPAKPAVSTWREAGAQPPASSSVRPAPALAKVPAKPSAFVARPAKASQVAPAIDPQKAKAQEAAAAIAAKLKAKKEAALAASAVAPATTYGKTKEPAEVCHVCGEDLEAHEPNAKGKRRWCKKPDLAQTDVWRPDSGQQDSWKADSWKPNAGAAKSQLTAAQVREKVALIKQGLAAGSQQSAGKGHNASKVVTPAGKGSAKGAAEKGKFSGKVSEKGKDAGKASEYSKGDGKSFKGSKKGEREDLKRSASSTSLPTQPPAKKGRPDFDCGKLDSEGRKYDLGTVVVNFANVGSTYGKKVLGRDDDTIEGKELIRRKGRLDWEGVRRCCRHLHYDKKLKLVGVVMENFFATDNNSHMKGPIPEDIKKMCEYINECPRIPGDQHKSSDDEVTIKSGYRRNCRMLDNDIYRDWKQQLGDEKARQWFDLHSDFLMMRYIFDKGLGTFDLIEGNIPLGMLAPDKGVAPKAPTKQALWTAPRK